MRKITKKIEEGARNAAILILAVGEERASTIFSKMDDTEIRDISRQMSMLGRVPSSEVEKVLLDFASSVSGGSGLIGSWQSTERILGSFLDDDRVSEIMEEMRGPAGRTMWEKLANVSEDILATYLRGEHPQTVAVILSKIKTPHAAKVLATLPEEFAFEVMQRMLVIDNVSREVIETVEATLRSEFMKNLASSNKADTYEVIADIFNNFDRSTESKFMDMLEKHNEEDAERVRSLMFTFEDLHKTDDRGYQAILREVEKDKLALALKGADEELKEKFFKNMSERASKIMKEDMESMGPVRVKEVDEAQQEIIVKVKQLIDDGQVVIIDESSGEEFI